MSKAYLNQIETAVPDHEVHAKFIEYAPRFLKDERSKKLFQIMAERAQIESRYSFLRPHAERDRLDDADFYRNGNFPNTLTRMQFYETHAFGLARRALDKIGIKKDITHIIVTSCTGFYAPGLDIDIVHHYGLPLSVERSVIGFMGCHAAFNALKAARHIVRSDSKARVLIVNLELCTLHLKETDTLEQILSFLIFADGCSAAIVSADAVGIEMRAFHSGMMPQCKDQITWRIGQNGFDMVLSGQVPATVRQMLNANVSVMFGKLPANDVQLWAVHPGGRSVLDAVQSALCLPDKALFPSRDVLRRFGNMSSATVMFVLRDILNSGPASGNGCAMAFGPGVTTESMMFVKA